MFAFDYCFWSMDESNTTKYAGKLAVAAGLPAIPVAPVFSNYSGVSFSCGASHTRTLVLVGGFAKSVIWLHHLLAEQP